MPRTDVQRETPDWSIKYVHNFEKNNIKDAHCKLLKFESLNLILSSYSLILVKGYCICNLIARRR